MTDTQRLTQRATSLQAQTRHLESKRDLLGHTHLSPEIDRRTDELFELERRLIESNLFLTPDGRVVPFEVIS